MSWPGLGDDAAEVAHIGAAVESGVGIEGFAPASGARQAYAIGGARHRREIAEDRHRRVALAAAPQERDDRLGVVVDDDPPKTLAFAVARVQRRHIPIGGVEVAHEGLQPLMRPMVEEPPRQSLVEIPLAGLSEFLSHEEELLAGMSPH